MFGRRTQEASPRLLLSRSGDLLELLVIGATEPGIDRRSV